MLIFSLSAAAKTIVDISNQEKDPKYKAALLHINAAVSGSPLDATILADAKEKAAEMARDLHNSAENAKDKRDKDGWAEDSAIIKAALAKLEKKKGVTDTTPATTSAAAATFGPSPGPATFGQSATVHPDTPQHRLIPQEESKIVWTETDECPHCGHNKAEHIACEHINGPYNGTTMVYCPTQIVDDHAWYTARDLVQIWKGGKIVDLKWNYKWGTFPGKSTVQLTTPPPTTDKPAESTPDTKVGAVHPGQLGVDKPKTEAPKVAVVPESGKKVVKKMTLGKAPVPAVPGK